MRNMERGMWKRSEGMVASRKERTADRFIPETGSKGEEAKFNDEYYVQRPLT